MNKVRFPIAEYVHQKIVEMEEKVRPAGVLKESPTETLLEVCNKLASIEIYNSQMKTPRRYQGT